MNIETQLLSNINLNNNGNNIENKGNMNRHLSNIHNGDKLETKLSKYKRINPFYHQPYSWYQIFKLTIFPGPIIASLKILLFIFFLILTYIYSVIVTFNMNNSNMKSKPLTKWRQFFRNLIYLNVRIVLFIFGFYYIPTSSEIDHNGTIFKKPIYILDIPVFSVACF